MELMYIVSRSNVYYLHNEHNRKTVDKYSNNILSKLIYMMSKSGDAVWHNVIVPVTCTITRDHASNIPKIKCSR